MAKITELPVAGPLSGTEPVMVVQDGEARQSTIGAVVEEVAQPFVDEAADIAADLSDQLDELRTGLGLGASAVRMVEAPDSISPSVFRAFTPTLGATYEFAVIARAHGTRRYLNLFNNSASTPINITFDLLAGTFVASSGAGSMRYLGGGFYECKATVTSTGTASGNWQARPSPAGAFPFTGDTAEGVWLKSMILRVQGTTTNLFPSSDPANAAFTKTSLTATPGTTSEQRTTEQVAAIDGRVTTVETLVNGSMTMDKLVEASGTVSPSAYRSVSFASGSIYTFVYELKAGERSRANVFNNGGGGIDVTANLATSGLSIASADTVATLTALNNGCYRLTITKTATVTNSGNQQLRIYPASGGVPYTGDGTSGLFANSGTLSVNGGANIWTASTDFSSAAWTKQNMTVAADTGKWLGLPTITGATSSAHPLNGKKVAMLGTSLVAQNIMPPAFAGETGAVIQNLGVSGGALGLDARGSPHSGSGAITATFSSIASDTNVIFLDMLVNDVAASDVPLGVVTDTTTATYCGALANFFNWCETNRPNAAVVVVVQTSASATYATGDYRHGIANANGNYLEDFQNATRRMCDYYGRPYIDPNRYGIGFLDAGEDTADGLHWDASGGARIAKIYSAATRELAEAGWLG